MTVRRAAFGALAAFVLGFPTACAGTGDHVMSFEPGEHQARVQDLKVDLVQARYAERQLTVECAVVNGSETAVTIDREGILLDDDGLEIPPVERAGQPAEFVIPPGGSAALRFSFAIGGLDPHMRTLGLWSLRSRNAALPPLRVQVPGIRREPS